MLNSSLMFSQEFLFNKKQQQEFLIAKLRGRDFQLISSILIVHFSLEHCFLWQCLVKSRLPIVRHWVGQPSSEYPKVVWTL